MEAFLVSTGIVALAKMGDKTQLLAFILATKFRKPVSIVLGHTGRHHRQPSLCMRDVCPDYLAYHT